MKTLTTYDTKPWYRQFWPWFLIALPGTVVVAAITTVFIAFSGADDEVKDEYVSDGFAIEEVLDRDLKAKEYGLSAQFTWDAITGEIFLALAQSNGSPTLEFPEQIQLQLIHPASEALDHEIILSTIANRRYRADMENFTPGRYYLRLFSLPGEPTSIQWRLQGELDFTHRQETELHYR